MAKAYEVLDLLPDFNKELFDKTIYADDIYRIVTQNKYDILLPNEYQHKMR